MAVKLFGFELKRAGQPETVQPAIAPPVTDDGAYQLNSSAIGGYYGTYLNLDTAFKNESELISRYRNMAMQPECEQAVDEIVNESIVRNEKGKSVSIILDDLEVGDNIKEILRAEFDQVLRLLNFDNSGADIFRNWYVDGRIFYQVQVDQANPQAGINNITYLDPRKIHKVRSVKNARDPRTGAVVNTGYEEFYVYNNRAVMNNNMTMSTPIENAVKIAPDTIININSGLMDVSRNMVLSYLHKAIKPMNQLRMIEDAVVIYRLSRAPERRVFYIDVGNLPRMKADQYLRDIMTKFRNKIVYDATTGEVRDDRRFTSMIEDFWIPRRGEGKSTEITTLPGAQNLGELTDLKYFEEKLYKSLNVPVSRLQQNQGFSLGRTTEITRDELKFSRFIEKLRNRFSVLFDEMMQRQLALKQIATPEEWDQMKEYIHYDFIKDNNFAELKEADLIANRVTLLNSMIPFVGTYYSMNWVRQHVLHLTEDEINGMKREIFEEREEMLAIAQIEAEKNAVQMGATMQPQEGAESEKSINNKGDEKASQSNSEKKNGR